MAVDDGRVVSNFIIQALNNEPITIYGDGSQTRSFCYVDDLIIGLNKMMNQDEYVGPLNLGNPNECTISDLANTIIALTKSSSRLVHKNIPEDDPKRRKPDITLAKKYLSWNPVCELEKGLQQTIKYFRSL